MLAASPLSKLAPRKARRRRSTGTQPLLRALQCCILAVDPGATSGYAIFCCGKLVRWGTVDTLDQPSVAKVVAAAALLAEMTSMPSVLVLERPWSARSLGASRAIWANAWRACCRKGDKSRIVREYPSRWRAQVFGKGMGSATQERAREAEQSMARGLIVAHGLGTPANLNGAAPVQHDAAAAISIGWWATHAAIVAKALPTAFRKPPGPA